jgi:hypothetical protein
MVYQNRNIFSLFKSILNFRLVGGVELLMKCDNDASIFTSRRVNLFVRTNESFRTNISSLLVLMKKFSHTCARDSSHV